MQINLTLIAQGINFFIAYWMVSTFLFRPAVAAVQAEAQARDKLVTSIDKEAVAVQQLELHKSERWLELQQDFAQNRPDVAGRVTIFLPVAVRGAAPEPLEGGVLGRLKDDVRNALVERIGNVD